MEYGLWEDDPLIAGQCGPKARRSPVRRLLAAVLMDAVQEFQELVCSTRPEDVARRREVAAWFFARADGWPFSFENVCEQLDLNSGLIRARIAAMADEQRVEPGRRKRRVR